MRTLSLCLGLAAAVGFEGRASTGCAEVVVGAGWAGVYFAYRRATSGADPSSICVFEAAERVGGRTYSVRDVPAPFTLDVGAYRFSPDMHLPGDLIMRHLELPTACYEPDCPDAGADMPSQFFFNYSAPLRRVVDKRGQPSGYVTPLEEMVRRLRALGASVSLGVELVAISRGADGTPPALTFSPADGGAHFSLSPALTFLNLPRNHLFSLAGIDDALDARTAAALRCVKFDQPASVFGKNWTHVSSRYKSALSKAYLLYEDAWWQTRVNLTGGETPSSAFGPVHTSLGIPIGIRWSDGPVVCSAPRECTGYLEVYYSVTNETFFAGVAGLPREPLGVLRAADGPRAAAALREAHAALLEVAGPLLRDARVDPATIAPPSQLVVGVWSRPYDKAPIGPPDGYMAPTKVYYSPEISGDLGRACGVNGLSELEYRTRALQPLGEGVGWRVLMGNNDWVAMDVRYYVGEWAEESLLQAERALATLGVRRPDWLDARYYADKVVAPMVARATRPIPSRAA